MRTFPDFLCSVKKTCKCIKARLIGPVNSTPHEIRSRLIFSHFIIPLIFLFIRLTGGFALQLLCLLIENSLFFLPSKACILLYVGTEVQIFIRWQNSNVYSKTHLMFFFLPGWIFFAWCQKLESLWFSGKGTCTDLIHFPWCWLTGNSYKLVLCIKNRQAMQALSGCLRDKVKACKCEQLVLHSYRKRGPVSSKHTSLNADRLPIA